MFNFVAITYYGLTAFLPLFLWRSKKNLYFIFNIPFTIVSCFFGVPYFSKKFLLEGGEGGIINKYTLILLFSTFVTVPFMVIGFQTKNNFYLLLKRVVIWLTPQSKLLIYKYGTLLSIITIALFILSYLGMGFVPALTDDPMSAKFFAGDYQDAYIAFAVPFRLALILSQIVIMLILLRLYKKITLLNLSCLLIILTLVLLSLRRGLIASQLIFFFLSYFIFSKKKLFWVAFCFYSIVFFFGSAANSIFEYYLGKNDFVSLDAILQGVPDIQDQLWFLYYWVSDKWNSTLGLSIIGGLIPYHSDHNIATLSKLVVGSEKNAATGGFRLPPPLLGFISFGWIGVVLFSILHGYLLGVALKVAKNTLSKLQTLETFTIYSLILSFIYGFSGFILNMQIDFLVSFIITAGLFKLSQSKITLLKERII